MATLVKTPAGTWKAVVRRLGWPTACRTFRLKRDATRWARRVEDEIARGLFTHCPSAHRLSFSAAIDRYLHEVRADKSATTVITDTGRTRPLRAFFGKYSISTITPDLVARYRDSRLATHRRIKDPARRTQAPLLAPGTVRLELALLSHMFTIAIREWRLGLMINPVACIRRPSPGPGRTRRLPPLEERKLDRAIRAYCNPMLGWMFRIALETAMRLGELRDLRVGDVDLPRRIVRLRHTKNQSERTVPLSRLATETFALALANPDRPADCDFVFFGQRKPDGRFGAYTLRTAWMDTRHKVGLDDLRFHDLRHEAVSRLVEAGLSDQEVAAISGHKSMQMLRRYTHLRAEDLVDRLDRCRPRRPRYRRSRIVPVEYPDGTPKQSMDQSVADDVSLLPD
jgi:integrase